MSTALHAVLCLCYPKDAFHLKVTMAGHACLAMVLDSVGGRIVKVKVVK